MSKNIVNSMGYFKKIITIIVSNGMRFQEMITFITFKF
jgi:hypothetical protein